MFIYLNVKTNQNDERNNIDQMDVYEGIEAGFGRIYCCQQLYRP